MPEIIRPKTPDEVKCDFCSSHEVRWSYPTHDFAVQEMSWGSHGGWAACDTCHDLIEAGKWDALIDHSLLRFGFPVVLLPKADREQLRQGFRDLYQRFRQSKFGPARPYEFRKE